MDEKDKETTFEIGVSDNGAYGKVKFKNTNSKVMAEIGGIVVDRLSIFRWERAARFFDKYNAKQEKRKNKGLNTPLPPKFLLPIFENAFIEENDDLQDLWVNLLSNWQDEEKKNDKKMLYIEIIKSLSPLDVKVLETLYSGVNYEFSKQEKDYHYSKNDIAEFLKVESDDLEISILNLFRTYCCESHKIYKSGLSFVGVNIPPNLDTENFRLTAIGYNLIESCINKKDADELI